MGELLDPPDDRLERPAVQRRETLAMLGMAKDVAPELEEDREPAVLAPAPNALDRPRSAAAAEGLSPASRWSSATRSLTRRS
jgi:hypothetical protein